MSSPLTYIYPLYQRGMGDFQCKYPKCSNNIFVPIAIRMMPPAISIFFSKRCPNLPPMKTPMQERINVTRPITITGVIIEILRKANPRPTASASMLVAMERTKEYIYAKDLYLLFSLFYLPCLIDHLDANCTEKQERNPVINAGDHIPEAQSGKPPNHRHKRLKCPKEQCNSKRPPHMERLHGNPAGDGDSKGIHCKANGNKNIVKISMVCGVFF